MNKIIKKLFWSIIMLILIVITITAALGIKKIGRTTNSFTDDFLCSQQEYLGLCYGSHVFSNDWDYCQQFDINYDFRINLVDVSMFARMCAE